MSRISRTVRWRGQRDRQQTKIEIDVVVADLIEQLKTHDPYVVYHACQKVAATAAVLNLLGDPIWCRRAFVDESYGYWNDTADQVMTGKAKEKT